MARSMGARTWTLALLLGILAAGCMGDSGGAASVEYDGTGNGTDRDSDKCDDDGTVVGTGTVDEGQVTIRVTDDAGQELYERTFDGGMNIDSERLRGSGGTWTLEAVRMPDALLGSAFSGSYDINLSC